MSGRTLQNDAMIESIRALITEAPALAIGTLLCAPLACLVIASNLAQTSARYRRKRRWRALQDEIRDREKRDRMRL